MISLPTPFHRLWQALTDIFNSRDHFSPHPDAGFEGYYSRTQLEDGGTLAVIFCWVKDAPQRANLFHVSYTPVRDDPNSPFPGFKYELFPDTLNVQVNPQSVDGQQPFNASMSGIGTMAVHPDFVEYTVSSAVADLHLRLRLSNRVPWSRTNPLAGPMGLLSHFSALLPLNWHVYSTASSASYSISHAGHTRQGTGVSHFEKNWGTSFPPGWIWSQAFADGKEKKSLCLAGGSAFSGVEAYLVGYRSTTLCWNFRPPFSVAIGPLSPFMAVKHNSKTGAFELTVQTFTRKLDIVVHASPDSFIGLAAPLSDGHRPMFAFESFTGRTFVQAWSRRWPWEPWTLVESGECGVTSGDIPCAALEFGGSYCHLVQDQQLE